ncbi:MAG TPA: hypothetical protein VF813_11475, partial [Anaerolineaceae bacterium]
MAEILPGSSIEGQDKILAGSEEGQLSLAQARFTDERGARRLLHRLADGSGPDSPLLHHLLDALHHTAEPDRVLASLDRLASRVEDRHAFLSLLTHNPREIEILAALFDGS